MASILSFFATSCCTDKPCPPTSKDVKTVTGNLTPEEFNLLAASTGPLYKSEVTDLEDNADLFYTYRSTNEKELGFVKAKITIANLIQYYKASAKVVAIRFYPSLVADTSVQLIMTSSSTYSSVDVNKDQNPVVLNRNFGSGSPEPISAVSARDRIDEYFSKVYIDKQRQDESNSTYKESRVFRWDEIKAYLSANISGFHIDSANTYANYSMVFTIGFTDNGQARRFYSRLIEPDSALKPEMLQGFTVIMYLNHVTEGDLLDNEGDNTSYSRKALEIAHVCPPVCGDLY